MHEENSDTAARRAKSLAYGLLVIAAMTFTFELGRQRGVVEARDETLEREDRHAVANVQLVDEITRLRASQAGAANPL